VVQTRDGAGTLVQVDRPKIGLRQVIVRKGHLLLNGRRLELRGASVQEDVPGRGPALDDADIAGIVRDLRAVHANVTRSHYLLNDRLLDRLDAAGILVWTQAPIFHRDVLLRSPGGRANALSTLRETILATRNHPSTLLYSVANELNATPMNVPPTQAYLLAAARETRDFDPTYRAFDALGVNSYFGWYPGKPTRPTGGIEETAPYLRRWHDRYRRQALVLTEFGAEATENGPAGKKQTFAFQADYLRRMLKAVAASPADGAIYWTLREFAVKPFWDGLTNGTPRPDVATDSIHNKGLISYRGTRKPAWAVAAKDFAATPLFPGVAPRAAPRRAAPPPAGSDLPGAVLVALCLLGLAGTVALSLRSFLALRAARREEAAIAAAANVVPLRREADGDHIAVSHDVVAAFES
jgi:beta-glucuronidase